VWRDRGCINDTVAVSRRLVEGANRARPIFSFPSNQWSSTGRIGGARHFRDTDEIQIEEIIVVAVQLRPLAAGDERDDTHTTDHHHQRVLDFLITLG
jgi:hypothetical protein